MDSRGVFRTLSNICDGDPLYGDRQIWRSTDILDHIKLSLRKDPDQILIHAGTNYLTNDQNYLKNVKKIVKLVRETCKDT